MIKLNMIIWWLEFNRTAFVEIESFCSIMNVFNVTFELFIKTKMLLTPNVYILNTDTFKIVIFIHF